MVQKLWDYPLTTIARLAGPAATKIEDNLAPATRTTTRVRRGRSGFASRWLGADIASEVLHQTQVEKNATLVDKTDALAQVMSIVADGHLVSAIVFDDTDGWLSSESAQIREESHFSPTTGRVRLTS